MQLHKSEFLNLIQTFEELNILVIGDLMLDKYIQGAVDRISPEAPVPVVKVEKEDFRIGGAGNVASNLASMNCNVTIASIVGNDSSGKLIQSTFESKGVDAQLIFTENRPTTVKTRILAKHQQIVRVDDEDASEIQEDLHLLILKK